jgi:hypothetical protein
MDTILIALLGTSKIRGVHRRLRSIISVVIDNRYMETRKLFVGSIAELFKSRKCKHKESKDKNYY